MTVTPAFASVLDPSIPVQKIHTGTETDPLNRTKANPSKKELTAFSVPSASIPAANSTKSNDVIYVDSGNLSPGNGQSPSTPVNSFKEAVRLVNNGGTIKIKGSLAVTDQYPVIDKNITFESWGSGREMLIFRGNLVMKADITFRNLQIDFINTTSLDRNIYVNGNHLVMDNITNSSNGPNHFPRIYAGERNNETNTPSVIDLNSGKYEFIDAGGQDADMLGDVTINLSGRSDLRVGVYARRAKGNVSINISGNQNQNLSFDGGSDSKNSTLTFSGYAAGSPNILNFDSFNLTNGSSYTYQYRAFSNVKDVTTTGSRLHILQPMSILGNFKGNGPIEFSHHSSLTIGAAASGDFQVRLSGQGEPPEKAFITAGGGSTAEFVYSDSTSDAKYKMIKNVDASSNRITWEVKKNPITIESISIDGPDRWFLSDSPNKQAEYKIISRDADGTQLYPFFNAKILNNTWGNKVRVFKSNIYHATLVLDNFDLNTTFPVEVTFQIEVRNQNGTTKTSDKTVTIYNNPAALEGTLSIEGEPNLGNTLTAVYSDSSASVDTLRYQWLRNGAVITGATKSTYQISKADIGNKISAKMESTTKPGTINSNIVTVNKIPLQVEDNPTASTALKDQPLSSVTLKGGRVIETYGSSDIAGVWKWADGTIIPTDGDSYEAIFIPNDKKSYIEPAPVDVMVSVKEDNSSGDGSGNGNNGSSDGNTDSGDGNNGSGDDNTDSGDDNNGSGDNNNGSGDDNNGSGDNNNGSGDGNNGSDDGNNGSGDDNTDSGDGNNGSGNGNTDSGDNNTDSGDGNTDSGDSNNGSGGGGSSSGGGGGSSSGGSGGPGSRPLAPPPTDHQISVSPPADQNGSFNVHTTDQIITDSITAAKEQAKQNGVEGNGISVTIQVAAPVATDPISNFSVLLPKTVQDHLLTSEAKAFHMASNTFKVGLNQDALRHINATYSKDIIIKASLADTSQLSAEIQHVIGGRPFYQLSIGFDNEQFIHDTGTGQLSISIPYQLQQGENPNGLKVLSVKADGTTEYVQNVTYDAATGQVLFNTNQVGRYGIAYSAN